MRYYQYDKNPIVVRFDTPLLLMNLQSFAVSSIAIPLCGSQEAIDQP